MVRLLLAFCCFTPFFGWIARASTIEYFIPGAAKRQSEADAYCQTQGGKMAQIDTAEKGAAFLAFAQGEGIFRSLIEIPHKSIESESKSSVNKYNNGGPV